MAHGKTHKMNYGTPHNKAMKNHAEEYLMTKENIHDILLSEKKKMTLVRWSVRFQFCN